MSKRVEVSVGDRYGEWVVVETGITNPGAARYGDSPIWSRLLCTTCGKTTRVERNCCLKRNVGNKCNSCATSERNRRAASVKVDDVFGRLRVVGDGGYEKDSAGHNRHMSICLCECGESVIVRDNHLKNGYRTSCRKCAKRKSSGEFEISKILDRGGIEYEEEYVFEEMVAYCGRRLRFDFVIKSEGAVIRAIEYDGEQHYGGQKGGRLERFEPLDVIKERDSIKNDFCIQNGIPLVRIPFWKRGKITMDDLFGDRYLVGGDAV